MKIRQTGGLCALILLLSASVAIAQIFSPPIVKKTVGTSSSGCASQSQITVLPGTNVFFCYTITNPNEFPLTYNLTDNVLGAIGSSVVDANSTDTFPNISEIVSNTITNTGTWSYADFNRTQDVVTSQARVRLGPAVTGNVESNATVEVANPLVPTLSDLGMLLFGIGIVGSALLLLRRTA
jgi:hypothetical protein